jgi:hypothetical protein
MFQTRSVFASHALPSPSSLNRASRPPQWHNLPHLHHPHPFIPRSLQTHDPSSDRRPCDDTSVLRPKVHRFRCQTPQPLRQRPQTCLRGPTLTPLPHNQARPHNDRMLEPQSFDRFFQLPLHLRIRKIALSVRAVAAYQDVGFHTSSFGCLRQFQIEVVIYILLCIEATNLCARCA